MLIYELDTNNKVFFMVKMEEMSKYEDLIILLIVDENQ